MHDSAVVVHSYPEAWGLASGSPFCLKLETWLRIADIPYRREDVETGAKSRTKKAPYIETEDGSYLPDSQFIIEALREERDVEMELTVEEARTAHLMRRTIEEGLYYALLYQTWVRDDHWPELRDEFFGHLSFPLSLFVPGLVRREVIKQVEKQGTGRLRPDEIARKASADIDAIAEVLGETEYFFGSPSIADAVAYGFLAPIHRNPFDDPLSESVAGHDNLVAFLDRIEERYW